MTPWQSGTIYGNLNINNNADLALAVKAEQPTHRPHDILPEQESPRISNTQDTGSEANLMAT